jgi:NAD(P)-dependent dehydrogenase (short-subunit alcohol dehydrogenase family)
MKTAIVTGASGNLGQAMVRKFLDAGYQVTGTILEHDAAGIVDDNFEKVVVDLMNEESSKNFVETVVTRQGKIDAAVLTVGGFAMGKIADTSTANILQQYKLNFETAYNIVRPTFVQMLKQGHGRIFIIGSKPGLDAKNGKGMVAYGLAKSLIFRLAELMNEEARGQNVVTTVVVPSTIDTPQNRKAMPDAKFETWVKPESIAEAIYFYTTDDASVLREPVLKVYGNA